MTLPPRLSLLILWYSLPACAMAVFMSKGLPAIRKVPVLGPLAMVVLGVLVVGMLISISFLGWPWHEAIFLLSPAGVPLVVPLVSRVAERFADHTAADLGYGVPLAQVFTGRAFEAARSGHGGVTATQPPEAARLKALEAYLRSVPDNGHHPV